MKTGDFNRISSTTRRCGFNRLTIGTPAVTTPSAVGLSNDTPPWVRP
jgi:hypothetical protein